MTSKHWPTSSQSVYGGLAMYECASHAKWILLGEHAVLRGHPAIVFPKLDSQLKLRFEPHHKLSITLDTNDANIQQLKHLIHTLSDQKTIPITGSLHFENTIPMGKGFGFSAALSICLAKLFIHHGLKEPIFDLAHQIEHHFHGKSSGLDIAGCLTDTPIYFEKTRITPIHLPSWPNITLIDSGISARSSLCIDTVQQQMQSNPSLAHQIDQRMKNACLMAKDALMQGNTQQLATAIGQGQSCFVEWGLVPKALTQQIKDLQTHGAISCKISGAGLGGLIIALYD